MAAVWPPYGSGNGGGAAPGGPDGRAGARK